MSEPTDFQAAAEALRKQKGQKRPGSSGSEIALDGGQLHIQVEQAERALAGHGIYQRGGVLVYAGIPPKLPKWVKARNPGIPMIRVVGPYFLATELTRHAQWVKYDARTQGYKPADAPLNVAKALLGRSDLWALPVLQGLVFAPTLRPDGSILEDEGYDESTGLLASFLGTEFRPVPLNPTRDQAVSALEMILELIRDFPFEAETDRAVAVSAMLTAVARPALRTSPLHAFSAHKQRSGKSLLAALPAYLATGGRPTVVTLNADPAEEKKRLLSLLLAGDPVINIDNVTGKLSGDALCSVLTEEIVTDRLLGASTRVSVPATALFEATGNNLTIVGDLTSRSVICRIDPAVERPEERVFDYDLKTEVPRRRGELVAAALTVLRAYHVAGRPDVGTPNWGGFEDWCQMVRDPLVWCGMADPVSSRRDLEERDPVRMALIAVLEAWYGAFGERATTVGDAMRFASGDLHQPQAAARLKDALEDVSQEKGSINRRKLGWFLSGHVGRIEGGLKLVRWGDSKDRVEWRVLRVQ